MQTTIRKPVICGLGIIAILFSLSMSAYWAYWAYGVFVFRPHASVAHDKLAAAVRASDEKAFKSLMAEHVDVRLRIGTTPYDSALMSHCFSQPKALMGLLREVPSASDIYSNEAAARGGFAAWLDAREAWVAVPDALAPGAIRGIDGVSRLYPVFLGLSGPDSYDDGGLYIVLSRAHDAEPYKLSKAVLNFSSEQAAQSFSAKAASWCGITPSLDSGYAQV